MKKTKLTRSLLAACSIVALSAVMYGCIHSGGGPALSELNLTGIETQAGASNAAGTYSTDDLPAALLDALEGYSGTTMGDTGDMVTAGDYTFTCVAGPCTVQVAPDGSHFTTTGTISVSSYMEPVMPPPDPAIAEREAISTAITAANTAVGMVTDTASDATVTAADNAIAAARKAIMDATNVPAEERAANTGTVNAIATNLATAKASRTAAMKAADDAMKAAMAKTGKAMHAALGGAAADGTDNALANIDLTTAPDTDLSDGLAIDAVENAGALATNPASVTLEAGDSAGSLGGWMGTNYAHMNAETKVANEAVVYNNKGPGKTVSLADAGIDVHTDATSGDDIKGYYTVDESADLAKIMGAAFTHSGTQTHTYDTDSEVAFTTRGTFDGAPGVYRCTGACSSTNDGKGSPSVLTGVWHFKPDTGAMVHQPDANYLYYGWWVSKDKDGMPTAASAFTGVNGTIAGLTSGNTPDALTGSATYSGHAAGKFALDYSQNAVLDGTSDGGHFTADATLTAKFGAIAAPNNGGISGTLDNFMANGESVDWSVSLHLAPWASSADTFATPTTDDATTMADETLGTTWSIGGTAADRSGTWSGQMYDEMPGPAPDGDGSTVPTTVTGKFYSEYSSVGRMVGAFGAEKE